jgi:small subunit ribosomal protein S21
MRIHNREPIGAALRRFKKLLERSGLTKELCKRKYYEKPCEARRRAAMRKQSAILKGKLQTRQELVSVRLSARASRPAESSMSSQRRRSLHGHENE